MEEWHALDATEQGCADLQDNRQSSGGANPPDHASIEVTVRYLGVDVDDALTPSERIEF